MHHFTAAFKKYAVFAGRSTRAEYWYFVLFSVLIGFGFFVIDGFLSYFTGLMGLTPLFALALILPQLSVTVRRLHDTGRSGWWIFIGLVPAIGGLWLLVLMLLDSKPDNVYGPNPKNPPMPATVAI